MNRKAYIRTLEVVIAFVITFVLLIHMLDSKTPSTAIEDPDLQVLKNFEQRPDFRTCVYAGNTTCIENMIRSSMPSAYEYIVVINDASYESGKNVFVDALYLTGSTASDRYIVRTYYWR